MTTLAIEPPGGPPAPRRIVTALAALVRARLVQFLAIGGAIFRGAGNHDRRGRHRNLRGERLTGCPRPTAANAT
jgi:hypothetical protein